jgi:HSP20 family protein
MLLNRRHPFGVLIREFNQAQDDFTKWLGRTATGTAEPAMNVWEDANAVYAEFDLPGVDAAKLEVTVTEGNQLTVQGERVEPNLPGVTWLRQERPFGKFVRVINLPTLVNSEKVEAKYEAGVLRLTLPKHEAAKPRKISVTGE